MLERERVGKRGKAREAEERDGSKEIGIKGKGESERGGERESMREC